MRKLSYPLITFIVLMAIIMVSSPVFALVYYATIYLTNDTATDYDMFPALSTVNTTHLVATGLVSASANDTDVLKAGVPIPRLMADDKLLFATELPGTSTVPVDFYTGQTPKVFDIITGYDGYVSKTDNASMEWGGDGGNSLVAYLDASTSGNITAKHNAVRVWQDGSENVTANVSINNGYISPNSFTDPSAAWTNETNVYDGNTATFATDVSINPGNYTGYLQLADSTTPIIISGIRFWVTETIGPTLDVDIDSYYAAAWHNEFDDVNVVEGAWVVADFARAVTATEIRIRFMNSGGVQTDVQLHEVELYSAGYSVSAHGVTSGVTIISDNISTPFFGMGVDSVATLPVTDNVQMNAPLWQRECNSDPFTSIDGNAYSWALTNAPTWSSDGYTFDGINQRLDLAGYGGNLASMTNITIEAIVNPSSTAGIWDIIARNYYAAGGFALRTSQNDGILNGIVDGGGVTHQFSSGATVPAGVDTYIAMTYDGVTLTMYKNGVYANSTAGWGDMFTSGNTIYMAFNSDGTYWPGTIRMLRIYDKALTADEILQNYNAVKSQITIGDIYIYSTLTTIPDNGNDWLMITNATPYFEYYKHYVAGTLVAFYRPERYISVVDLLDLESNNDAIIHWGTNPAGITANVTGLIYVSSGVSTMADRPQGDVIGEIGGVPLIDDDSDLTGTGIAWLEPILSDLAEITNTPVGIFWWFLILVSLMCAMGAAAKYTQNLFLIGVAAFITVGADVAMLIIQPYIIPVLAMLLLGALVLEKKQAF